MNSEASTMKIKFTNVSPSHILFGSCLVGFLYESCAHMYRQDKFRNMFRFMLRYPGWSIALASCSGCLGIMYRDTFLIESKRDSE